MIPSRAPSRTIARARSGRPFTRYLGEGEPLVEPVGGADVLLADADGVVRDVVDRPVEEMVVREHEQDVGPRRLEPPAELAVAVEHELPVRLGRLVEPAGEPRGVGRGHGGDDGGHGAPYRTCSGYARRKASSAGCAFEAPAAPKDEPQDLGHVVLVHAHVVEPPDVGGLDRVDLGRRQAELAGERVEVLAPSPPELGVPAHVEDHLVQRERAVDLLDVSHRASLGQPAGFGAGTARTKSKAAGLDARLVPHGQDAARAGRWSRSGSRARSGK